MSDNMTNENWTEGTTNVRTAVVRGARDVEQVQRYMPANYEASAVDGMIVIIGVDVAGWTLDDYVIPRLASGLIFAKEIVE